MQGISDFIFMMFELAVPLVLAAEAAMIAERAGVIPRQSRRTARSSGAAVTRRRPRWTIRALSPA